MAPVTTPGGPGSGRDDGPATSRRAADSAAPGRTSVPRAPGQRRRGANRISGEMAKPTSMEQELGVRLTGMPFSETFNDGRKSSIIHRVSEPSVRQLVDMRHNDGQARGLYRLLTMPVRAAAKRATWVNADANDGEGSASGEEEAEFAEALLTTPYVSGGMQTPWSQVLGQMLLSTFDGFSAFELVYQRPKRGPLEGKIALKKMAYRPSETVSFVVDDHGDFDGLKQRTYTPNGKYIDEYIEKDYSFYVAMNEEENPFYGVSFFNAAFYHYDKKVKLYYLAHLAAQHRAVGSRLGKYPSSATPTELAAFRKALADFGLAQSVTVPAGSGTNSWSVEDLGKSLGDFPFMDFINHHNSQASKSVLAPFFDDAQGGEKSLVDFGDSGDSMYTMLIDVIVNDTESVINNWLLPRFIDWNFGSYKYPKMQFGAFSDDQKRAIKDTFDKLAAAGTSANVTRPFLLELEKKMAEEMGLEIEYDKISEALKKQTDLTIDKFMQDLAPPPNTRPFQAVGAAPADQEQGVAPNAQWMPGAPPPIDPMTGMPMPQNGPPGGTPPQPGRPAPPRPGQLPPQPPQPISPTSQAPGPNDLPAPPGRRGGGAAGPVPAPQGLPAPPGAGGAGRRRRGYPAFPSQLQASALPSSATWLGTDDPVALTYSTDLAAVTAAMAAVRSRELEVV